jgi:hypothetical protein
MKALLLIPLLLSSCVVAKSGQTVVAAFGGKGAAKSGDLAMTWDNEKSFNDLAWVALAAVPAMQAVKIAQSADALTATQAKSAERVTINAANNAAATEQLGIKTAADVTKATTLPK